MTKTACVLGAGIQGVCVALMLQKHGFKVQVIDKSWDMMTRTSMTREGKIHMGFIYGMDKSLRTGYRMIEDSLNFAPGLDYLLGTNTNWDLLKSKKDMYLVTKDSMLSTEETEAYFEILNKRYQEHIKDSNLHYLGSRPEDIFRKVDIPKYINSDLISSAYLTEEVSVNQPAIKDILKRKIQNTSSIEMYFEHYITEIKRKSNGFVVTCKKNDNTFTDFESDMLVNCLWESRIYFDNTIGINEEEVHSLRLKYGLALRADDFLLSLDSVNFIHGAYGSFVIHPHDKNAFFCWYPASMKGLMKYGKLPETWEQACNGIIPQAEIDSLTHENFHAFKKFIPHLEKFDVIQATAGVILAEGEKDIDKKDSGFHSRVETPIRGFDDYYSVSTSKFTSAPRNTLILEKILFTNATAPF